MSTLPRIMIGAVLVLAVVVVAAGAGWWFFIREDNELATDAPAIPGDLARSTAGAAGPGTPAVASGTLAFRIIPERSEAAYFAGEKLAALPLPSTAKGSTTAIEGVIYLTPDGTLDTAQESKFTVDLRTLKSDKDMRDSRVQNQALETSRFPTATFVATGASGYEPAIAEGEEQTLKLTGTMDLHGVQKELTWDVKARKSGDVITALATVNFLFADFNITAPNIANFVAVQDDVTLQVQIVAEAG